VDNPTERTRFSFTRSELRSLIVLAVIFIGGLIFQQLKRHSTLDKSEICIIGADTLESRELESLLQKGQNSVSSDSASLDLTGSASLTSTVKLFCNSDKKNSESFLDSSVTLNIGHTSQSGVTKTRNNDQDEINPENKILDLNRATGSEIQTLPGIGPVLSGRIIEWREKYGPFSRVEDLLLIRGFGKKRLEKLKPFVTVKP